MTKADRAATSGLLSPRFQSLMAQCRDMAISHLAPLFKEMEENIEVALLDFAEKAESNAAQTAFFEAMGEVRHKHAAITRALLERVKKGFDEFPPKQASVGDEGSFPAGELSLLDKDEVELSLPLTNMTAKANAAFMQQLYGLDQRLAILNGGQKVTDTALPAGPSQLAEAIREAVSTLETDNKINIILFALYDKFVMKQLEGFYEEFNKRLVDARILPNLKYEIRKRKDGSYGPVPTDQAEAGDEAPIPGAAPPNAGTGSSASTYPAGAAGTGYAAPATTTLGDEVFGSILSLMAGRRQAAAGTGGRPVHEPPPAVAAQGRQEMITALNEIQGQNAAAAAGITGLGSSHPLIEEVVVNQSLLQQVKTTLADERRKLYEGVDRRKVPSADMDIIDLVGMLFDYILEDEKLTSAMKALLSRLHTPYLKIAVMDRDLFTREEHPARKLLNEMARAGAQWASDDQLDRGIFPILRAMVETVLGNFDQDLNLFDELREKLDVKLAELQHKAGVIEQRAVEAARGQAKLQAARQRANLEISRRLGGGEWPARIVDLLQRTWSEKLMFILLRDKAGEESTAWAEATNFIDRVLASVDRDRIRENRSEFEASLLGVNTDLSETINQLSGFGHHDTERLMTVIADCQQAALAACTPRRSAPQEMVSPPAVDQGPAPYAAPDVMASESAGDAPVEIWETVPAAQQEVAAETNLTPEEEDTMETLRQTKFGTWFEFTENGRARRLRLAWFSVVTSNCMFVDGTGVKAGEKSFPTLAREMCEGSARIVEGEKAPLFDRALNTIFGFLKRSAPAMTAVN